MTQPMRLRSSLIHTPSGDEWRVGRRWVTRGLPRWRRMSTRKTAGEVLSVPDIGGPDDLAVTLAIIVGTVVVAVIVIPLLLFGIELILLGLVVAAGIIGRGLLGRPWIVQATRASEPTPTYTWKVSGWRRSARLIDEVVSALSVGRDPSPSEAQEPFTSTAQAPPS
jgi:hypothetical protein